MHVGFETGRWREKVCDTNPRLRPDVVPKLLS
jgi:hypothetical protein